MSIAHLIAFFLTQVNIVFKTANCPAGTAPPRMSSHCYKKICGFFTMKMA